MRIVFVCLGNICRSPMAEFVLKDMMKKRGITGIEVCSRATSNEEEGNRLASGDSVRTHRKGDFLVLFRDRSGAVRRYSIPHARKKSSKNALFSVLRIFAEKKSPCCGLVFARQTTEIVLDRTVMGV